MVSLARNNLFHDKVRLGVTLIGVVFAVVLVAAQLGLFIGFMRATSNLIDRSGADIWISATNVEHIEVGVPISQRTFYKVLATPGVESAAKYIVQFVEWKQLDGAVERVELVGYDVDAGIGGPWSLDTGGVQDLKLSDNVIVDRVYLDKLGVQNLGDIGEIRGRRARVVGFTRGIITFTTAPIVFTSFKNAQKYGGLGSDQTIYILAKALPNIDRQELKRRLQNSLADVDVHT